MILDFNFLLKIASMIYCLKLYLPKPVKFSYIFSYFIIIPISNNNQIKLDYSLGSMDQN